MSRKTKNDIDGAANLHTGDYSLFSSVFCPLVNGAEKAGQGQPITTGATKTKARQPCSTRWVKRIVGNALAIAVQKAGSTRAQSLVYKGGRAATSFYSDSRLPTSWITLRKWSAPLLRINSTFGIWSEALSVFALKTLHEIHQHFHGCQGRRVVNGCAAAAHTAVSFQTAQPVFHGFGHEGFFQVLAG